MSFFFVIQTSVRLSSFLFSMKESKMSVRLVDALNLNEKNTDFQLRVKSNVLGTFDLIWKNP